MRTDLTVRGADGTEHDVAVLAPPGTTLGAIRPKLPALPDGQVWAGTRPVSERAVLGAVPLLPGVVLAARPAPPERAVRWVQVVGGPGGDAAVPFDRRVTVGRDPSNDLVAVDPRVSRRHAALVAGPDGTRVTDLGSTHGTLAGAALLRRTSAPLTPGDVVRLGDTFVTVTEPGTTRAPVRAGAPNTAVVRRSPVRASPPHETVLTWPADPDPPTAVARLQWAATLLPAVLGGGLAWLTGSWEFLAFVALTPLSAIAGAAAERRHRRHAVRRSTRAHDAALDAALGRCATLLADEAVRRRAEQPDPGTVRRIACLPTPRLWERTAGSTGALQVRVGLGDLPARLRIDGAPSARPPVLAAVPVTVDLARGAVGVTGPPRLRADLARWLVAQLTVQIAPSELEIVVLGSDPQWRWTRWLPHRRRLLAGTHDEQLAVLAELRDLIHRQRGAADRGAAGDPGWTVLVCDPAQHGGIPIGVGAGVTAVISAEHLGDLPDTCTQVVSASGDTGTRVTVSTVGDDASDDGWSHVDAVADRVTTEWAETVARALAPLRPDGAVQATGAIPAQVRLLDLVDPSGLDERTITERWAGSDGGASCIIGVRQGGAMRIDLDVDGPHALVAGSTGSGKSELLQTMVAALALAHPPQALTVLLIDYKGGAAFGACADLPHTVGVVTDLDASLGARVLTALDSELRRRELLLQRAGAHDLADYRERGSGAEPLPRLVVVVDEFAGLVDELGGFVPGLVGIARRGRSLGLHLVLATQRPAGVVSAEIRANTALRICLRVTSPADSIDVLESPVAADVPARLPGRAHTRSSGGLVEFQAARVNAAYAVDRPADIRVVPLDPWRRLTEPEPVRAAVDLLRIAEATRSAAEGSDPPRRPWLPPLPRILRAVDVPAVDAPTTVPFGLTDRADVQSQPPLTLDLAAGTATLVVGRPGSGRTTALRTLAGVAAQRLPPHRLHVYAVDARGDELAELRALPHTGTVATRRDGADFTARVVAGLGELLDSRRHRPAGQGVQPYVLVLVDGWDELVAASDEHDAGRTTERLLALLRDAAGARAGVVVTGGRGALAPRLTATVSTRIVLAMNDPADLVAAGLAPRTSIALDVPGRGAVVGGDVPVQIATPPEPLPANQLPPHQLPANALTSGSAADSGALRWRPLPVRVSVAELGAAPAPSVTLGVAGDRAERVSVDLSAGAGRLLVAGPPRSGRTSILAAIRLQWTQGPVVLAAPTRSPLASVVGAITPATPLPDLPDRGLLIVDDVEAFTDSSAAAAFDAWLCDGRPGRVAVVAGRSDALAMVFRGLAASVRAAGCGVLLQPGAGDGALLGVALPVRRAPSWPGRGMLVPDPAWRYGVEPLPMQAMLP